MKSIFFKAFSRNSRKRAKSFIARLFGLCLLCSGSVASAEWNSSDRTYLQNIESIQSQIQSDLNTLNQSLSSSTDPLAIRTQLHSISVDIDDVADSAWNIDHTHLPQILALLRSIAAATNHNPQVHITNSVNVSLHADDVLAGNPWWATNSRFSLTFDTYDPKPVGKVGFSFPEFASQFAVHFFPGWTLFGWDYPSDLSQVWDFWGVGDWESISSQTDTGYSYFDFVADLMKSNLVSQGSYNSALLRAINCLTNSFSFSPVFSNSVVVNVTNLNSNETWITNLVNLTVALTNILYSSGGEDILAGNPWWSTNSGFNLDYYNMTRNGAFPSSPYGFYSFPQLVSLLSSTYYQPHISDYPYDTSDFDRWGTGGANWKTGVYTFFDWLADYYKSNLVLNTSSSYSNLLSESSFYDTSDDSNPTNVPLPQYSLPASEQISGAHDTLTSAEYDFQDKLDSLQPNYTGGDDEIVVIPAFSVGGINVREYRARLGTSITPVCRLVASFIWYVGLFAFLFSFAKSEFVYYASLGKFWVKHA